MGLVIEQAEGQTAEDWWQQIAIDAPGRHVRVYIGNAVAAWDRGEPKASDRWLDEAYAFARKTAHIANEIVAEQERASAWAASRKALQGSGTYL